MKCSLKILSAALLTLGASPAFSAPCSQESLATFKKYLTPDIVAGAEQIVPLFDRAISGSIACELTTAEPPAEEFSGGRIAMCGAGGDAKKIHTLAFNTRNTMITLTVREEYDCGTGYWLTDISSDRGQLLEIQKLGTKFLGLVRRKACAEHEPMTQVGFRTSGALNVPGNVVATYLNLSELPCNDQTVEERIVDLSN